MYNKRIYSQNQNEVSLQVLENLLPGMSKLKKITISVALEINNKTFKNNSLLV